MITLEDVQKNEEVQAFINASQKQLEALGYTDHSNRHIGIVSKRTGEILQKLGYDERTVELGKIAGYLHDIGNCINRVDHAHSGAILAYNILKEMGMPAEDRTEIVMAIGNHDEKTGTAVIRNKIKRRVKNIIDNNKNIVQKNYDYVIIVKKGIIDLTYQEMEKELLKLLSIGD